MLMQLAQPLICWSGSSHEFDQARLEAGGDRERPAPFQAFMTSGGGGEDINLGSHWTILSWVPINALAGRGSPIVTSAKKKLRRSDLSGPLWRANGPQPQSTDEARASSGAYRHLVADTAVMLCFAFMTITQIS